MTSTADTSTTAGRPTDRARPMPLLVGFALAWFALLLIVVVFADFLTPHDVMRSDLRARL